MRSMFARLATVARATPVAVALAVVVVLAPGGSPASGDVAPACGPATVATLTALEGDIATNIYHGELGGSETQVDLGHVTSAPDLLSAVAADDPAATLTAVKRLVYHPFWHIVRLRVFDAAGTLLADFGGPYVIAPVNGVLRSGTTVIGSFVMSVQDDVGFTKIEAHAMGDPIGIYVDGQRVVERGADFPLRQPMASSLTLGPRSPTTRSRLARSTPCSRSRCRRRPWSRSPARQSPWPRSRWWRDT
jgi:diadenosine tetraphosphatase ApaH/serine/threonine PP2A family protein phosphatase